MSKSENKLPEQIKVKVYKYNTTSAYFAELPEFGVFTEASTLIELHDMVNDLIYELFDVPKKIQSEITYSPSKKKNLSEKVKSLSVMMTPDFYRNQYYVS